MKKYEVPMYGYVRHIQEIEANSPEEAIKKAYKIVDEEHAKLILLRISQKNHINKDKIYTNFDFDTEVCNVEEVDNDS